ncbi:MAG: tRNA-binding protein [Alphaproteobacteria bacterium]|nr:tRNA-binding protein [Alphaproteobacteria bacterium]MDA7985132.1 tRNA-binding protein [Alphaproteobacteria bacterium]MDA7989409.1 tRNA-binding protein [Alphaproteobacteria bacterium]MDA8032397.1 tRNA-binding protein [Alphaproteobacteria bacterium]
MSEGTIAFEDFQKVDIRVGTILSASPLEGARKPSICLRIDFGELGERQSAAQLTRHYDVTSLVGKQVLAVCNFEPRRIAGFRSEVLVCGFPDGDGEPVLVSPDIAVANGGRLF